MIIKPIPRFDDMNSPTRAPIMQLGTDTRNPAMINGNAEGSCIFHIR